MTIIQKLSVLCLAGFMPVAAQAEPKIYAYSGADNYCQPGMQPVSINGIICCGVPNQGISYQQAMAHPAGRPRTRVVQASSSTFCPEGEKGCYLK
ncbi:MAG: hypothetical protein JXR13_12090 [Thalassovita sp.]